MNLKLVVASMSVLGLISCPAFAATHSKHKKPHHKMKHHIAQMVVHHDYKDMGNLPIQPAPEVCTIRQSSMLLDGMTQNIGRSLPNQCNPGWFNRVALSGGINVDLGKWGNRNGNYMGENYQRLSLNDAYLNIAAVINDWTKAFASISYNTATINNPNDSTVARHVAEYDAAYSNNVTTGSTNTLQLEQAYATFSNFDMTPIFVQVGKQFQDFGRYEIHPITESMTQVMSKTLATSAKIGFIVPMGFHGSVSVFDDPISKRGQTTTTTNYGAALGYDAPSDQLGWDIGAAYLYNLIGANDIAYSVNQFNINNTVLAPASGRGYVNRTGGVALYADVNSGPFTLDARWTTATQRFNVNDLPKNGIADLAASGAPIITARGARPWAAGIQAGYGFEGWGRNQNVYVGYQASGEAAGLNLPHKRWLAGYGIDVLGKGTNIGIELDHDVAYSASNGGTANNTNLVSIRSSVEFG